MRKEAETHGIIESYGPSPVSRRLEAALRGKAGDYVANRLMRDHRLPREEMTEGERKAALMEFIEAMTEFLGKEDAGEILIEVGCADRAKRQRAREESAAS